MSAGGLHSDGEASGAARAPLNPPSERTPDGPAPQSAAPDVAAPGEQRLTWAGAQLVAWTLLAVVSVALIEIRGEPSAGGLRTRVLHGLYDAGQLLAAGVVVSVAMLALRARGSRSLVWTVVGALAATFTLGWTVLKQDLASFANHLAHLAPPVLWRVLLTLACSAAIPGALLAGRYLARWARLGGVLWGVVFFVVTRGYVVPHAYPGMHLFWVLAAAALIGGSLGGARLPAVLGGARAQGSIARRLPWMLATLWGACAILIPPPAQVLFEMLRAPASVFAPFIAQLHTAPAPPPRTPEEVAAALSTAPAVPPSQHAILPADGAVVLVTIDCLRADLVETEAHAAELPNLFALRRTAVQFTAARAAGTSTIGSLGSMFTGRYQSQLAWSERQTARSRYTVPSADPSPRFPELLAAAGVPSMTATGAEWLDAGSGILRGFTDERSLAPEAGFAAGEDLVGAAVERVEGHERGPLFLFLHLFDAHEPYTRGGTQGSQRERYLRELSLVDRELGRLVAAVDGRFAGRAVIMVTADHGEAFGEHNATHHGGNVYDEVVRVPLLVRAPGSPPRAVADSVSLLDLGPTVLDLFHQATPATFMGQSLVPLLAGQPLTRARPVAIESGTYTAVLFDDGWKILRNKHQGTVELYDLGTDPEEKTNLFQERDPAARARLNAMDAFFEGVRAQ